VLVLAVTVESAREALAPDDVFGVAPTEVGALAGVRPAAITGLGVGVVGRVGDAGAIATVPAALFPALVAVLPFDFVS
jgi:hypothetical protein